MKLLADKLAATIGHIANGKETKITYQGNIPDCQHRIFRGQMFHHIATIAIFEMT